MQRQGGYSYTRTLSSNGPTTEHMDVDKLGLDPLDDDDISVIADRLSLENLFRNSEGAATTGQASDRFSLENNYKTKGPTHVRRATNAKQLRQTTAAKNATIHHAGARTAVIEPVHAEKITGGDVAMQAPSLVADEEMVRSIVGHDYMSDVKPETLSSNGPGPGGAGVVAGRGDEGEGFRWSWDEIKSLIRRPFSSSSRGSGNNNNSGRMSLFRWSLDDVKERLRSLGSSGGRESQRAAKHKRKLRESKPTKLSKAEKARRRADRKQKVKMEAMALTQAGSEIDEENASASSEQETSSRKKSRTTLPSAVAEEETGKGKPNKEYRIRRVKKTQRERQRRGKVSTLFENLGSLLDITPQSSTDAIKDPNSSRAAILSSAVDEIRKKKGLPPRYSGGEGLNSTPNPRFASDLDGSDND